jgi:hypothetical protein
MFDRSWDRRNLVPKSGSGSGPAASDPGGRRRRQRGAPDTGRSLPQGAQTPTKSMACACLPVTRSHAASSLASVSRRASSSASDISGAVFRAVSASGFLSAPASSKSVRAACARAAAGARKSSQIACKVFEASAIVSTGVSACLAVSASGRGGWSLGAVRVVARRDAGLLFRAFDVGPGLRRNLASTVNAANRQAAHRHAPAMIAARQERQSVLLGGGEERGGRLLLASPCTLPNITRPLARRPPVESRELRVGHCLAIARRGDRWKDSGKCLVMSGAVWYCRDDARHGVWRHEP